MTLETIIARAKAGELVYVHDPDECLALIDWAFKSTDDLRGFHMEFEIEGRRILLSFDPKLIDNEFQECNGSK